MEENKSIIDSLTKKLIKKTKVLLTLEDYIELGGIPYKGLKLFTCPGIDVPNQIKKDFYSKNSKTFTFVEIVEGKGVRVEESEKFLGTGWLFLVEEVMLCKNQK